MINTLQDAVAVVDEVGSPAVSVIADRFHMSIEEPDISAAIHGGPHIQHVQLGDTDRLEPGHGHYDWPETLEALKSIGYDGWLAMECRLSAPRQRCYREWRRCSGSDVCRMIAPEDRVRWAAAPGLELTNAVPALARGSWPGTPRAMPPLTSRIGGMLGTRHDQWDHEGLADHGSTRSIVTLAC